MSTLAAFALAVFLAAAGVCHFVFPQYFRSLVPAWLGRAAKPLVVASGLAELILALLLIAPEARSLAAWGTAALITTYMASHVDALVKADRAAPRVLERPLGAIVRIVVNLLYVAWAVAVAVTW